MELIPIKETLDENEAFVNHPDCLETLYMSVDFYKRVGFQPPWIGYYVKKESQLVGYYVIYNRRVLPHKKFAYGGN